MNIHILIKSQRINTQTEQWLHFLCNHIQPVVKIKTTYCKSTYKHYYQFNSLKPNLYTTKPIWKSPFNQKRTSQPVEMAETKKHIWGNNSTNYQNLGFCPTSQNFHFLFTIYKSRQNRSNRAEQTNLTTYKAKFSFLFTSKGLAT